MRNLVFLLVFTACSSSPGARAAGTIADATLDTLSADTPDAAPSDTVAPVDTAVDTMAAGDATPTTDTAAGDVAAAPKVLTLDPKTLTFFSLPINSLRMAVAGLDPVAHACVSLIFDFSNTGASNAAHCDDFHASFPYALVKMGTDGPCKDWQYGAPDSVISTKGCVDFAMFGHADRDLADLEVQVATPDFTGLVRVDNRTTTTPNPVSFVLNYLSDVPEYIFIQQFGDHGAPAWVQISKDGAPVIAFDRCDTVTCDLPGAICASVAHQVIDIMHNSAKGSAALTWDGRLRTLDAAKGCMAATPAPPGNYTATFCFGSQVKGEAGFGDVLTPECHDVPFTLSQKTVVYTVNAGG